MARNQEFDRLEAEFGIVFPHAQDFIQDGWKRGAPGLALAMDAAQGWSQEGAPLGYDAQPALLTTAGAGIPALFTTMVDPEVVRVLLAPLAGADILGEAKRGTWIDDTIVFPMVEMTGEVSSYGDFNNNGRAGAVGTWPQRQSYHFQVIIEYGEREIERAGAGKLNWVTELKTSAANTLNRFQDLTYHFGVAGLQNYGLLNDPQLPAALTPATKAAGGTRWITVGGVINATANEVYSDVQSLYIQLVAQSAGVIDMNTPMTLVSSPTASVALTATNNFNVSVRDLLAKNFPNLKFKTSIRYATTGGQVIQLIADRVQGGGDTGFCAFTEKMREHNLVKDLSSFKQKETSGTWGAVIKYPVAIAQMLGV